jgi:hypothetical protein
VQEAQPALEQRAPLAEEHLRRKHKHTHTLLCQHTTMSLCWRRLPCAAGMNIGLRCSSIYTSRSASGCRECCATKFAGGLQLLCYG